MAEGGFCVKCQNCGIHFDDHDKECPICGYRAGKKGRLSGPSFQASPQKESASRTRQGRRAEKLPAKPRPAVRTGVTLNGKPARRKNSRKGVGVAVAVLLLLLNIAPPLLEKAGTQLSGLGDVAADLFGASRSQPETSNNAEPLIAISLSPLDGQWRSDRADGGALDLSVDAPKNLYSLAISSPEGWLLKQSGTGTLYWSSQENGVYSEEYPPEQYDCYLLELSPVTMTVKQDSDAALPGIIERNPDGISFKLLLYRRIDAPKDEFLLYDYTGAYAQLFPDTPETLLPTLHS